MRRSKRSEERYRTLFESGGTSLVILDEQNRFKLVNQAFETLSGYSREEIVGKMSILPVLQREVPAATSVRGQRVRMEPGTVNFYCRTGRGNSTTST